MTLLSFGCVNRTTGMTFVTMHVSSWGPGRRVRESDTISLNLTFCQTSHVAIYTMPTNGVAKVRTSPPTRKQSTRHRWFSRWPFVRLHGPPNKACVLSPSQDCPPFNPQGRATPFEPGPCFPKERSHGGHSPSSRTTGQRDAPAGRSP